VKRMHGLNVEQYTAFGAVDTQTTLSTGISGGSSQNLQAQWWEVSPLLCRFIARLSSVAANAAKEIYMKRAYMISTVTNHLQYPMTVEILKLWCKLDLDSSQDVNDIGQTGVFSWGVPFYSITTGHEFHKYFKIMKYKRRTVRGGKSISVRTGKAKWTGPITGNTDGSTSFQIRKGNPITVIRVYGCPLMFPSSPDGFDGVCYGPYYASLFNKLYYSYYAMDDATPTYSTCNFNGIWPRIPDVMPGSGIDPLTTRQPLDGNVGYVDPIFLGTPKGNNLQSVMVETS